MKGRKNSNWVWVWVSGSMHVPIEGLSRSRRKDRGEVAIGLETVQNHAETRAYLERISNRMHEPLEGRSRIGCCINQKNVGT